ncbi:MAG: molecular chaperone HtpG, partial [Gammaproteobacteria bacterium]
SKPTLEVNIDHALVQRLNTESDEDRFKDWAQVLFDQAMLSEGGQLEDPASYVRRINELLQATLDAA